MTEFRTAVLERPRRLYREGEDHLPGGTDYIPLPDISPIRAFRFPTTPVEFRAMVGLGEQSLISPEEMYEEKREKVEEYVDHEAAAIPRNWYHGGSRNLNYVDSRIQARLADQSLPARIWRGWMKKRLEWLGVQNGEELLQTIEENVRIINRRDLRPAVLVHLIKTLDSADETEALRKLHLAFERARQFYLVPGSWEFKGAGKGELTDFMSTLGNTPEGKWQEIYHQFDGRTQVIYHYDSFCSGYGVPESNGLLQIIKQGGLNPKQQQTLYKAAVWGQFGHALPFIKSETKGRSYEFWLDYNDLLNPAVGPQLDHLYPYLVDWAAGSKTDSNCSGPDLIVGLKHLEATDKLDDLNMLINSGWNCHGIYEAMKGLDYHSDVSEQLGRINQALAQATTFQADTDNIGWVKAFNEYFHGMAKLFTTQVPSYEEMIRNKDTLMSIAFILESLPKREGFKAGNFLKMEDGKAKINRSELAVYLENVIRGENLTDLERSYVNGFLSLSSDEGGRYAGPSTIPDERLSFYLYLAVHRDSVVPQIFNSEGNLAVQASFVNELSSQGVFVDSELMGDFVGKCTDQALLSFNLKMVYFDKLSIDNRVSTLTSLPDELLAGLPVEMQASIAFFRQLSRKAHLVVDGIDGLSKYINNGQPTAVLVDNALAYGYFQEIRHFLTPELMSSFTPEQRQFFQACLNLPAEVVKLISQGSLLEWQRCFINGKPGAAFLRKVANRSQQGEVDKLLAITDLSTFSPAEQAYWSFYKSISASPNLRRYLLLSSQDNFSRWIVNGQPTMALLDDLAQDVQVHVIPEVLGFIKVDDLPDQERIFWEFYPKLYQAERSTAMRIYLLRHRDSFGKLIQGNRATPTFLNQAATFVDGSVNTNLIRELLSWVDISQMPFQDLTFWRYYSNNQDTPFALFLLRNRSQFSQMIMNGQETPLFYQLLVTQEPNSMLEIYRCKPGLSSRQYQDLWRVAIGKDVIDNFLAALPPATDEARNAFTGNTYDRTSEFIWYLKKRLPVDQFGLTAQEFSIMTQYIRQFGLARNETIYKYYRFLHLFEHQQIADLPEEMKELGVTSINEMIQRISEVRKMVFGVRQLTDPAELRNLTSFQIQMLANVTRYDSARFGSGNTDDLSSKISQFARDLEEGSVAPLPTGYKAETIEASSVKIEFNAEAVKGDYEALGSEILECIDNPPTLEQLKSEVRTVIERRVGKTNDALSRVKAEKAVAAMTRNLATSQTYLSQLDQVQDTDSLILSLLGMNFSNEERSGGEDFVGINSVMRRIVLSKLYQKHSRSPGFLENTRIKLSKDEVTAEGIDEIVLTIDEMVKNHVLSLDFGNKEGYLRGDIFKAIMENDSLRRNFRKIIERFNPHAEKLRQEQARFKKTQTGKVSNVRIIPDRGFIGEMAGYLADVCYIRIPELLKTYSGRDLGKQLVVPYKFVIDDTESGEPRFIGSVLVFETQTVEGESSLLVRALDIPDESEIDISKFTESLLDKFAEVAARRGKTKVQVAGTAGTISNYSSTTSYILGQYVREKAPDPVSPVFDFNGYNITNLIYTVRIISI